MNVQQFYHSPKQTPRLGYAIWALVVAIALTQGSATYAQTHAATPQHVNKNTNKTSNPCTSNPTTPSPIIATTPPDIRINGDNLESSLASVMLTNQEPLTIEYYPRHLQQPLQVYPSHGRARQLTPNRWQYWPASPAQLPHTPSTIDICAGSFASRLLLWPSQAQPKLTQQYQQANAKPAAFIAVRSAKTANTAVSPHFRLSQFLPQHLGSQQWPKYTLISFALIEKLELVMKVLHEHDIPATTLTILSGFRYPQHNQRVGGAPNSRHIYGDAVDFIVDVNNDGKMDDLNQDGEVSRADLHWLTDRLARRAVPVSAGGIGSYESAGTAAAFLHLDARGRPIFWK